MYTEVFYYLLLIMTMGGGGGGTVEFKQFKLNPMGINLLV